MSTRRREGKPAVPSLAYGFRFIEPDYLSLRDVSATFYDLGVLYDTVALTAIPEGATVNFRTQYYWTRTGRPVPAHLRPYVLRASYESPLLLELAFLWGIFNAPTIISRWTTAINDVFDLSDRIRDRREERREVRESRALRHAERQARLRQLRREELGEALRLPELVIESADEEARRTLTKDAVDATNSALTSALTNPGSAQSDLMNALEQRDATYAYENTKRRLREAPMKVEEAEVFEWTEDP